MKIYLHPASEKRIAVLKNNLPQSILLSGPRGIGLGTIARDIAGKYLATHLRPQNKKNQTDNDNGTISVETIRELYTQTRAKQMHANIIIIDDADRMSRGAAAAFLKLLEEPSDNTHFILTSHAPQLLPPTINSRVQELLLQFMTPEQTDALLDEAAVTDTTKRTQLRYIANGLPAELLRLIEDDDYFKQRAAIISDARTLLMASTYDKLLVVQKYQSNRDSALQLVDSALAIARHSITAKPQATLINQLDHLLNVREHLQANFSVRLQLTQLVL